jgi:hypothetical protein
MSGRAGLDTGCQRPNASGIDASRSIKLAVIACVSFHAAVLLGNWAGELRSTSLMDSEPGSIGFPISSPQRCASLRGGAGLVLVANQQNSCASCRSKQEGTMSELEENRLLDSEFHTISSEPLIGRLNLETDLGTIDLLVNRKAAEFLISVLLEFLAEGTGGDAPKFKVHTEQ